MSSPGTIRSKDAESSATMPSSRDDRATTMGVIDPDTKESASGEALPLDDASARKAMAEESICGLCRTEAVTSLPNRRLNTN